MSAEVDEYHRDTTYAIYRLKCNKIAGLYKHEIQECQNELMRIKSRLNIFNHGKFLEKAEELWHEAYDFNREILNTSTTQILEELDSE